MAKRALTVKEVEALKEARVHWVAPSLYLQIRDDGTRSWLFRYFKDGKDFWHGLGAARDVKLREARERADELRVDVRRGAHPIKDRKEAKAEAVKMAESAAPTFEEVAKALIALNEDSYKNVVHRKQWPSTMERYVYPTIGHLPVDQVTLDHVHDVLKDIWKEKHPTATKVRGRISAVLDHAIAMNYRPDDNPARPRGPLDKRLARVKHKVKHHKSVPYADVPELVTRIRALRSASAQALLFTILTGVRSSEAREVPWDEFDFAQRMWNIPAERMKADRPHSIPLSDELIELLESRPRDGRFVFQGQRPNRPLSNMAMLQCLRGLYDDAEERPTVHGFRASLSSWAREQARATPEVVEMALSHTFDTRVIESYAYDVQYLDIRRTLMQQWASYCYGREWRNLLINQAEQPPAGAVGSTG